MAGNEFPTSVSGSLVVGVVPMALDAAGVAQASGIPGADKIVHVGITSTGAIIFAEPNGLTSTQISALTTTQIQALTSGVIIADAFNSGSLTTTVINALTPGYIYDQPLLLTTQQLNTLSTTTIAALTTTQIAALGSEAALAQVAPVYGNAQHLDLPVSTMLAVAPVAGQTLTVTVRDA